VRQVIDASWDRPIPGQAFRLQPPREILNRLQPNLASLGITRLGDLTGLDELGLPVAFAARPNSFSLSLNLGKGFEPEQATVSAAMEATECAVAERMHADVHVASIAGLRAAGQDAIDLSRIARLHSHLLGPDAMIGWVAGEYLGQRRPVLVPWGLAGLDHRLSPPGFHDAFEVTTDGLASGGCRAEAVLHGLFELIERDAYALIELAPRTALHQRAFAPRMLQDSRLAALQERLAGIGYRVVMIDMTTDIAVPSFMALLAPRHAHAGALGVDSAMFLGCGCNLDAEAAIASAVLEAVQARLAYIAGARDDFGAMPETRSASAAWFADERFPEDPPSPAGNQSVAMPPGTTLGERIEVVLQRLAASGIEDAVAIPLDSAIEGIEVVRVIVPDLQIPLHGRRTQLTKRGLRQVLKGRT
jgi:ribosomal protein S12 methylthiotransferase accessory factor